jgi:hypothetical protein
MISIQDVYLHVSLNVFIFICNVILDLAPLYLYNSGPTNGSSLNDSLAINEGTKDNQNGPLSL